MHWGQAFVLQIMGLYSDVMVKVARKESRGSTATISRTNRSLNYGGKGYKIVFERLGYMKDD